MTSCDDREMIEMIEKHLHDFQVARFKVLQVFQVLLCLMIER